MPRHLRLHHQERRYESRAALMPGQVPVIPDEREQLLAYLEQQRDGLRFAAFGLTDEQARLTPTAGTLSVGGLVKHVAITERHWMDMAVGHDRGLSEQERMDQSANGFRLVEGETLAATLDGFGEVAAETEGRSWPRPRPSGPVPKGCPGSRGPRRLVAALGAAPPGGDRPPRRPCRHRPRVDRRRHDVRADGGAEGWPETEWIKPWRPPA